MVEVFFCIHFSWCDHCSNQHHLKQKIVEQLLLNSCAWYVFRCYGRIPFCLLKFSRDAQVGSIVLIPQRNAVPQGGTSRDDLFGTVLADDLSCNDHGPSKKYTSEPLNLQKEYLLFF